MDQVYVVASTLADIGKGWLTASITSLVEGKPIKIDPDLTVLSGFEQIENFNCSLVSSDAPTYKELGLDITTEAIIRGGEILFEFLYLTSRHISEFKLHTTRRQTFADVSKFFANKLEQLVKTGNYSVPVIEVGGSVYDDNVQYLADGIRCFANDREANLDVVSLSYLERSDDVQHLVKVNRVVDGIKKSTEVYRREPKYVFVRDRATYGHLPLSRIEELIQKIADRSHIPLMRIIYEPEVKSASELKRYIEDLGLFNNK